MAVLTQKLPPRNALIVLMSFFILGNLLCTLLPSYDFLILARIVTDICHCAFFCIGTVEAAALVPPTRRAQAVALMFTGLTIAIVLGVPLGAALGQESGWRAMFWAITAIGIAALGGLYLLLPKHTGFHECPDMLREFLRIRLPVWIALSVRVMFSASAFSIFTYVAPLLNQVTHISPRDVTYTLFLIYAVPDRHWPDHWELDWRQAGGLAHHHHADPGVHCLHHHPRRLYRHGRSSAGSRDHASLVGGLLLCFHSRYANQPGQSRQGPAEPHFNP
ncbi:MFS transporter [Acidocella aminolytica]|uniref:MFS transporter n=1 Tax=Acidocella aminolytica TaxID=33998 RepID=UPI0009177554|nr:MFS transporter [Acidocella aminolytica]SHE92766.1 Major Facilitator Superfamily protein [Acidocella aminolytica 101 = DSM 11237]